MSDEIKIDARFGNENRAIDDVFRAIEESHPPKARDGRRITVCAAAEIAVGQKRIVEEAGLSIGVFNVGGNFFALKNVCPHQGAPLCQGTIHATHRPSDVHEFDPALAGRILRCPWHGWEFDIVTGKGLHDATTRVATYPVEIDANGDIVMTI